MNVMDEPCFEKDNSGVVKTTAKYFIYVWQTSQSVEEVAERIAEAYIEIANEGISTPDEYEWDIDGGVFRCDKPWTKSGSREDIRQWFEHTMVMPHGVDNERHRFQIEKLDLETMRNRATYWRNQGVNLKKLPLLPSAKELNEFAQKCAA